MNPYREIKKTTNHLKKKKALSGFDSALNYYIDHQFQRRNVYGKERH